IVRILCALEGERSYEAVETCHGPEVTRRYTSGIDLPREVTPHEEDFRPAVDDSASGRLEPGEKAAYRSARSAIGTAPHDQQRRGLVRSRFHCRGRHDGGTGAVEARGQRRPLGGPARLSHLVLGRAFAPAIQG